MKQMRSRFRLITLLLVCAFVVTLVLCTGSVLKAAGISLSSLSSVSVPDSTVSPDTSLSPESPAGTESSPAPSDFAAPESDFPGTDNSADPEYNTYGL